MIFTTSNPQQKGVVADSEKISKQNVMDQTTAAGENTASSPGIFQPSAENQLAKAGINTGGAEAVNATTPFLEEDQQEPISANLAQDHHNDWRPYNHSQKPGFISSLKVWWLDSRKGANICMGRADYWWGYLAMLVLTIAVDFLFVTPMLMAGISFDSAVVDGVMRTISIPIYILSILTTIERLHDTGHSGWNFLLILTGIGGIYVLLLCCQKTKWSKQRWPRPSANVN